MYCAFDCNGMPLLTKLKKYIDFEKSGFYIEAGAFDGIFQSNTKYLEEEYGWKGILIEPSPLAVEKLKENRPHNIVIHAGLVSKDYDSPTIVGDFHMASPMCSVYGTRLSSHRASGTEGVVSTCEVPALTLSFILEKYGIQKVDILFLDVEGYEYQVLQGIDFNQVSIDYLMIEIYTIDLDKIVKYLQSFQYELVENITNYHKETNPYWDGTHNDYLFRRN